MLIFHILFRRSPEFFLDMKDLLCLIEVLIFWLCVLQCYGGMYLHRRVLDVKGCCFGVF